MVAPLTPAMASRIELWPLDRLTPYAKNARTHSDEQIAQIAGSIVEYGFTAPLLVSGDGGILAGHSRLAAAKKLALDVVPVIVLDHLTPTQRRAYILADNQLALQAGWNEELLASELADLSAAGFDLALTGFSDDELADLLNDVEEEVGSEEPAQTCASTDEDIPEAPVTPVSQPGDIWQGAIYIAMSSSELDTLQSAFRAAGGKWSTFIIWAKNTFTLGRSDYQRQYEPILYGWPEGATRHWCGDRDQSDVWQIKKPHKNDLHPTMKPVELVERAIRNSSRPGDVVLDPFGGSGTTLIAAEKSGRQARLIELDPKYADVIVSRWQQWSGKQAIRESDGVRFDDLVGTADAIDPADAEVAL